MVVAGEHCRTTQDTRGDFAQLWDARSGGPAVTRVQRFDRSGRCVYGPARRRMALCSKSRQLSLRRSEAERSKGNLAHTTCIHFNATASSHGDALSSTYIVRRILSSNLGDASLALNGLYLDFQYLHGCRRNFRPINPINVGAPSSQLFISCILALLWRLAEIKPSERISAVQFYAMQYYHIGISTYYLFLAEAKGGDRATWLCFPTPILC